MIQSPQLRLEITVNQDDDGRWCAGLSWLVGVYAYGPSAAEAARELRAHVAGMVADSAGPDRGAPPPAPAPRPTARAPGRLGIYRRPAHYSLASSSEADQRSPQRSPAAPQELAYEFLAELHVVLAPACSTIQTAAASGS